MDTEDLSILRPTYRRGTLCHRIEHRLQIKRRSANEFEEARAGSLSLMSFDQLPA